MPVRAFPRLAESTFFEKKKKQNKQIANAAPHLSKFVLQRALQRLGSVMKSVIEPYDLSTDWGHCTTCLWHTHRGRKQQF